MTSTGLNASVMKDSSDNPSGARSRPEGNEIAPGTQLRFQPRMYLAIHLDVPL